MKVTRNDYPRCICNVYECENTVSYSISINPTGEYTFNLCKSCFNKLKEQIKKVN